MQEDLIDFVGAGGSTYADVDRRVLQMPLTAWWTEGARTCTL